MKCLEDIDALVATCREFPYPDLIKPLESLRAQIAIDVAPYRVLVMSPPLDEIEPE